MKLPVHESEVEPQVWYANSSAEIRGRALCDVGGIARIGVGLMELPPGCNTKPAHYHTLEEEHLYVIEGTATLYLGDQSFELSPGSYVCFPAGDPNAHYLSNEDKVGFRYLMIGERNENDQVVHCSAGDNS